MAAARMYSGGEVGGRLQNNPSSALTHNGGSGYSPVPAFGRRVQVNKMPGASTAPPPRKRIERAWQPFPWQPVCSPTERPTWDAERGHEPSVRLFIYAFDQISGRPHARTFPVLKRSV